jgi:hypothetical protein
VPVIVPHAAYTIEQARAMLGLRRSSLSREVRLGRLRVSKRVGLYFILGTWLLQWVEDGELPVRRPGSDGEGDGRGKTVAAR